MSSKIAAALPGAACALALCVLPARAQDYGMLWGPQPVYPPTMIYPRWDYAPAYRPQPNAGRSYFKQFRRRTRSSSVMSGTSPKRPKEHDESGVRSKRRPVVSGTPRKQQAKNEEEGGTRSKPRVSHAGGGAYRTLCVRSCDGYYWPISYATSKARFRDDEKSCKASCPNQKVALYTHRTEGEWSDDAVSLKGKAISALKNAFVYRQEYKPECTCKLPQPLVASSGATKRHAKVSAGSPVGSERKDGIEPSAAARNADADPGTTGSIASKAEPDKDAGQSNRPAEAEKSAPTRRVRIVGPQFLVDR